MALGDMGPGLSSPFNSPSYNNPTSSGGGTGGDSGTAFGDNAKAIQSIVLSVAAIAGFVGGFAMGYLRSGGNLVVATVSGVVNVLGGIAIYNGAPAVFHGFAHVVRNVNDLDVLSDENRKIAWTGRGFGLVNR